MPRFKKGDKIKLCISGSGMKTREDAVVLKVTKAGVWLDNGPGNSPSGPFDEGGGDKSGLFIPGFSRHIESAQ